MNIEKQIAYWIESSNDDLDTAEILISKGKLLHGLFFCHLCIEKGLKSIYVKQKKEIPPKTHNLIFLLDKVKIEIKLEDEEFLGVLMKYQIEGRFPDYNPRIPSIEKVEKFLKQTKRIQEWIKTQL